MTLPAIVSILDPAFKDQTWTQTDKRNFALVVQGGQVVVGPPIGDLPERRFRDTPTAEGINGILAVLREIHDVFAGTTPITSADIEEFFRLPRYTTAQLTNALAISQGEGTAAYNTTTNRIVTSNGATWDEYVTSADVPAAVINVFGGGVDTDDTDTLDFHEQHFELTDNGDGSVSIEIGTLSVANLPAGVDRTLFTYHTVAGPDDTTAPTDILSQSIAGNTLSADGQQLEVELRGDHFNQSGNAQSWLFEVLLGGVAIYTDTTATVATGTVRRPWRISMTFTRVSSTTLYLAGQYTTSTSGTSPDVGLGDLAASSSSNVPFSCAVSSPTVAWGSSQTLQIRLTCSSATNTEFLRRSGSIKRIAV